MRRRPTLGVAVAAATLLASIAGCSPIGSGATPSSGVVATPAATPMVLWPRPSDTLAKTVATGLVPETVEHLANHVHAHLDVFLDGVPVIVASGIGINIDDPEVTQYTGDPREIQLSDRREIAIVIGTAPAVIPKTGDFSGA